MSRPQRCAAVLVALVVSGCDRSSAPAPSASSVAAPPAAAESAQRARRERELAERLDAQREPRRPGEAILGTWGVTTPSTLKLIAFYEPRIAATPSDVALVGDRDVNVLQAAPWVTVYPSRIDVEMRRKPVVSREYDVLRETPEEVEIQLRGGDGERAVLTVRGENELHVPGLVGWVGGAIWRRSRTPGVGFP